MICPAEEEDMPGSERESAGTAQESCGAPNRKGQARAGKCRAEITKVSGKEQGKCRAGVVNVLGSQKQCAGITWKKCRANKREVQGSQ